MKAEAIRHELMEWLAGLEDKNILQALLSYKKMSQEKDWYHTLSKSDKARLKKSEEDEKAGRIVGNDEVLGKYERKTKR